jgi:iron transport multicopper oxidase
MFVSLLSFCVTAVSSSLVTQYWNIDWVNVNPDGQGWRPAIGINGQWPCPTLEVTVGDTVAIAVQNNLGNESTSIHWHGLHQTVHNQNDGPPMVTQCPIPLGGIHTYTYTVNQTGTYWYHSHADGSTSMGCEAL